MSLKYKYFTFFLLFYFLTPLNIKTSEKNIYELISQDKNLSIFFNYLKNTGLDVVLKQKSPWNWTIFAPSNEAFKTVPKKLKNEILSNNFLSQNLLMDHILAKYKTSEEIEEFSKEVTISNKSIELYNSSDLFVKDMIVTEKDLIAKNGVVHVVNCIMFVQPSIQDSRLDEEVAKKFPITSCCMRKDNEVILWLSNLYKK